MCGALFGLSYVLVRLAAATLGPVDTTAARTLLGGATLLAVAGYRRQPPALRSGWRYLALGILSAAVPFSLISVATLTLNAGSAAVLNASSPIFALTIDAAARRRLPRAGQLLGVLVAIAGVVTTMAARGLRVHGEPEALLGVLAGLTGAAVFAYGGFFAAARLSDAAPLSVAAGQQLAACVVLLPAAGLLPPSGRVTSHVLVDLVMLGLFGSGLAYLLFYWLIGQEGPTWTANVNLLVPCFGVLWGWVILREPVPLLSLLGMAVTIGGLALILRAPTTTTASTVEGLAGG